MSAQVSGIRQQQQNALVIPFGAVRRSIGWLGLFLPVSLVLYGLISVDGILGSMSAYYYSSMREVFVGTLCAIGVFLWSYRGYLPAPGEMLSDRLLTRIAAIGAVGIAVVPTLPDPVEGWLTGAAGDPQGCTLSLVQCIAGPDAARWLHLGAAVAFFGAQALIALVVFTRGDRSDPDKRAANRLYGLCGWTIIVAMLLILLLGFTRLGQGLEALRPVFWLEIVASVAIALNWMVKGDAVQPIQRMLAR